ncbi:ion transport peptide-like [Eupeodes corollae]|uniref:ion transport peptide-like n=1 Tax=Eupeodes corollae TaxID=290404 RepID=UPI0024928A38|nr:ion transport peptide-like [Eupeodes corollae]XP_055916087.1 ion transport peptide-like [Eupeodes corollae]XP_055916088.1 ion transport peptide-like [Eupeodes corollae]XP_055916089.1 ion transport peptide-like [Eupeodes corollae]
MCSRNLKISVVLILLLVPFIVTLPHNHSLSKRSNTFFELDCKGVYNKSMFFRLDRICEDCYQLFRETTVHRLCKKNCFTTDYFKACVEALHLGEEVEALKTYVKTINGAAPPPTPYSI